MNTLAGLIVCLLGDTSKEFFEDHQHLNHFANNDTQKRIVMIINIHLTIVFGRKNECCVR